MADSPPFLSPRVIGANTPRGMPAVASGTFTANGSSAPTVYDGIVSSVRRLVDGGALPFFRVKLNARYPFSAESTSITLGVETNDPDAPCYATVVTGQITPAPADAIARDEFDIAIFAHSSNSRVDTAATRVSFHLHFAQ